MSEFQAQLDQEIEKQKEKSRIGQKALHEKKPLFCVAAFLKGLVVCTLFFAVIVVWAWVQKGQTENFFQDKLASKTAIIKQGSSNIYRLSDVQPVLTMPDVNLSKPPSATDPAPDSKDTAMAPLNPATPTSDALVAAPVPGLYESAASGLLPLARQEDGLTPFDAYKRPFQKNSDKPLLSIIVTDLGVSKRITEGVINNLAPEISLAFSPYAQDLKLYTDVARQKGHEVWLTLPMETAEYPAYDPGPSTLLINASVEQNQHRLVSTLATTQGYAGFISQKDHIFRQEDSDVNPAIQQIFSRGLAVIDSNTSVNSFVSNIASKNDYPHGKNNFWLDDDLSPLALNRKIRQIIEYGQGRGRVVVMLRPYPISLKTIQKFLNSAAAKEFQLAPVSAQVSYDG